MCATVRLTLLRLIKKFFCGVIPLLLLASPVTFAAGTVVRMQTSLGAIDIQLYDADAPNTVVNFLSYVNSGAYTGSLIHRSVPGFIIQGGGYGWNNTLGGWAAIAANSPVVNEYSKTRSNLRGTIAMAKLGGNPDSATNQWFFNLADNSANLDTQNGGFTVFGKVIGNGMQVVDAIAALPVNPSVLASPLDAIPEIPQANNSYSLVVVSSVTLAPQAATGWNLLGNSLDQPVNVTSIADDPGTITSVWKWDAAGKNWQFYTPSMDSVTLQSYALSKGYGVLSVINPGEGYWVNANATVTPSAQPGALFNLTADKLVTGWNLLATGNNVTPAAFNTSLGASGITTLWAWDNASSKWVFYSPSLDAKGGSALSSYITSKGYLDFATTNKKLGNGTGFWVNR